MLSFRFLLLNLNCLFLATNYLLHFGLGLISRSFGFFFLFRFFCFLTLFLRLFLFLGFLFLCQESVFWYRIYDEKSLSVC